MVDLERTSFSYNDVLCGDISYKRITKKRVKDYKMENKGLKKLGGTVAAIFAILCIVNALSMGCVIQINAVSRALLGVCNIGTAFTGGVLAVLTVAVIVGSAASFSCHCRSSMGSSVVPMKATLL